LQDAVAIEELLGGSKRCLVQVPGRREQSKVRPELCMERLRVVPNHVEPAAAGRPLRTESADDNVAAASYRANYLADVRPPVGCGSQEMKNRAIMPHVVGRGFQFCLRDVGDEPANALRRIAQPLPASCDGRL